MVDLNIDSNRPGITYALSEYAKEFNGGKPVKFNKEQWQSIMKAVSELNSKRSNGNNIFTGGNNLFGRTDKNFIVNSGKITFTDEEMAVILREMGLRPKETEALPTIESPIKGLSVERNPNNAVLQEKINVVSAVPAVAPKGAISAPIVPMPSIVLEDETDVELKPVPVQETVQETVQSIVKETLTEKNSEDFRYPHKEIYNEAGELVRRDYPVDVLNWKKSKGTRFNVAYEAANEKVSRISVRNSNNETVAHVKDFKFYIGDKEVNLSKFEKYTAKHGETLSVEYKKPKSFWDMGLQPSLPVARTVKIDKVVDRSKIKQLPIEDASLYGPKTGKGKGKGKGKVYLSAKEMGKIGEIARKLKCDQQDLLAVMNSESGVTPDATNFRRRNGKQTNEIQAYGVIQFTQVAIDDINEVHKENLSFEKLKTMPLIEQLDYAEKYLLTAKKRAFGNKPISGGELYALVYLPGMANKEILAREGHKYYDQNSRLDYRRNGFITKEDLDLTVQDMRVSVHISNKGENV